MQHQDKYKTILVIVTGLLILAWIFEITLLTKVAVAVGGLSILFPPLARWVEWAWFKLAIGLGWVNSRILLSAVYFLFLMPIAWLSRLFTKDPLQLRARNASSLYVNRDHQYKKDDLENIW